MTRPARLSREQYLAPQFCFVTVCTKDRRPTLVHPKVADFVVGEMWELFDAVEVDLTTYCVMPDHIHLLLGAEATSVNMRVVIERAKQRVGFRYAQLFGVPLWQRSYFDHTLRSDEAIESVIAYAQQSRARRFCDAPGGLAILGGRTPTPFRPARDDRDIRGGPPSRVVSAREEGLWVARGRLRIFGAGVTPSDRRVFGADGL